MQQKANALNQEDSEEDDNSRPMPYNTSAAAEMKETNMGKVSSASKKPNENSADSNVSRQHPNKRQSYYCIRYLINLFILCRIKWDKWEEAREQRKDQSRRSSRK